jgi:hypothetical protein
MLWQSGDQKRIPSTTELEVSTSAPAEHSLKDEMYREKERQLQNKENLEAAGGEEKEAKESCFWNWILRECSTTGLMPCRDKERQ